MTLKIRIVIVAAFSYDIKTEDLVTAVVQTS